MIQTQGKGGVGKSVMAVYLAQYFLQRGINPILFDADIVNPTLSSFTKLGAQKVSLGLKPEVIDPRYFDLLMENLLNCRNDDYAIIDIGASSFLPLVAYMAENRIIDLFLDAGHKVRLQSIIVGGQPMLETMTNLSHILKNFPRAFVDIWLNEYFNPIITKDGKFFEDTDFFKTSQNQIKSIIAIPSVNMATYGYDINKMLSNKLTFSEAIDDHINFNFMARQRLKNYSELVFNAIELAGYHG